MRDEIISKLCLLCIKSILLYVSQKRLYKRFHLLVSPEKRGAPAGVDSEALGVHHVVIGENLLARIKVKSFNAPLRRFQRLRYHSALYRFVLGNAEAAHHLL